jgi:hypothetical protein
MEESPNLKPRQSNCWSGARLLETVRRLNERGLALLTKAAQGSEAMDGFAAWKAILLLLTHPSEETLSRAARCPMVLLDFNFQRGWWWRRVASAHAPGGSRQATGSGFHTDEAIPLARDLLLEAWSASRSASPIASLVFGMAPEVTTLIARLSPCDVDRVVVNEVQEMRPRWENQPTFWKDLFYAAAQMDDQALANVHLHCLQLLGGEWVVNCGKPPLLAGAAKEPMIETSVTECKVAKRSSSLARLSYAENTAKPSPRSARRRVDIATN